MPTPIDVPAPERHPVHLYQVDAFTDRPFAGNPAAVCVLDAPADASWMQALARELDLPATAFAAPVAGGRWWLRWYTSVSELTLCGHGTLAASHALLTEVGVDDEVLRYETVSGDLTARSGGGGAIELDLPAHHPVESPADAGLLTAALFPRGGAPPVEAWRGGEDLLAIVPTADHVTAVAPDAAVLGGIAARCVIISAAAGDDAGADVVSRVFAPSVGVLEDPVTGSAHCLIGPYWSSRLGRTRLLAHQASARGGDLVVEVRGERVSVGGTAVTVTRAALSTEAGPAPTAPVTA